MALALALVSCTENEKLGPVNENTDLYTVPAESEPMTLSNAASTWSTDRRYFDLTFGSDLVTRIVGFDALLAPGQYVLGDDVIGNAVLAKTKVKGTAAKSGFITVGKRDSKYTITASIDGQVLSWTGTLPFTPDPDPTKLTVVMSAQSNLANNVKSLTLNLATDGISQEFDMTTYQTVWKGEGGYLALDIYSEDGYLHPGTYMPCAEGGVIEAGQFGIGYDTTVEYWGQTYEVKDWGTCWWTVADGAATATKITDGIVTVKELEDGWQIDWGKDYPVQYSFTGAIPALTKPKGSADFAFTYKEDELQTVSTQEGAVVPGVMKHPVTILNAKGEAVAYFEMLLAEGETDLAGEFPSTSYASAAGQLADGWEFDASAWGMGIMKGGSYFVNAAGEEVLMYATLWTLKVVKLVTGAYEFIGVPADPSAETFDIKASGPDYVPGSYTDGGGDGDGDDVSGDVVLKITSGLTYTMEDVTAANTDSSQNPLSGMTLWRVNVKNGGDTVAAFDLGTEAGSEDLSGTYTVMSYPNAVGKAGNGWGYAAYNFFGGCYFKVDGSYYFIPADATINVSNNADGTLKIKFEGSIQKDDYSDGGKGGLLLDKIAKS